MERVLIQSAFNTLSNMGVSGGSISSDKKSVKLLYFGERDALDGWISEVSKKLGDELGINGYHVAYSHGYLDSLTIGNRQGEDNVYPERDQRLGSKAWDDHAAGGQPGIYERATDTFLVPYVLAVKAEGGDL